MKNKSQKEGVSSPVEGEKKSIVVYDDGNHLILKQITPEFFDRAFHRTSGISTYSFLTVFSTIDSDDDVFFGQFPRHAEFKRKIAELVSTKYCITRGQVSINSSGEVFQLHLFDEDIENFSDALGKKSTREIIKKVLSLIDESFLTREILISINGSLSHIFYKRGKRLKPVKK